MKKDSYLPFFLLNVSFNFTSLDFGCMKSMYNDPEANESEWTDRISRQILLYAKRGVLEMKKTKWWRSKGAPCARSSSSVSEQRIALSMHNVAGLFIILGVGLIFAFCTVIVEFCIRSRQLARDEQKPFFQEVLEELRFALNISKVREHRTRRNVQQNGSDFVTQPSSRKK